MADTITSSQNLTITFDDPSGGDTITKMVIPDCKHGLTESQIKSGLILVGSSPYVTVNGKNLFRANITAADETATEKINISLE